MIVVATNQYQKSIVFTDRLKEIVETILLKVKKYEELGRIDKAMLISTYLSKIYLILKYWVYSGLSYNELDKCIEEQLECSLQELKEKLKILPRELWIDLSGLMSKVEDLPTGINNIEIIGILKDNIMTDFQSL